jgi:hypothetical protein
MRVSLASSAALTFAALLFSAPQSLAQDECATATAIALGPNGPFDNTGFTVSAPAWGCSSVSGADIWFSFAAPALGGQLTIDTEGSTGLTDTVLEVFDACGGASVACDDDGGTALLSSVSFATVGGTTYFARVGGFGSAVGTFMVNVAFSSPDDCGGAIPIFDGANGLFDNTGATTSAPPSSCSTMNSDIWFVHTASCDGMLTVDTHGAGTLSDTVMEAWDACGGTVLACNDDSGGLRSTVVIPVLAGTSYFFRIGDYGVTVNQGTFPVTVTNAPTPGGFNDECACAIPLALGPNAVDTTGSTVSAPGWTCGFVSGGDLWYTYTAAGPGCVSVTFDTFGSAVDTVLQVWDTCGGTVLGCNDDTGGFPPGESQVVIPLVSAGQTLVVRAARYSSATGPFTINVSEASAAPADDECAGATPLVLGMNAGLDNVCCTPSVPGFPCSFSLAPVNDKWWTFTAGCTAPHTFSTCTGALSDTVIQVLDDCTNLTDLGCNDDFCSLRSSVTVNLTAGVTYLVRCGGWNGGIGTFDINITTGTNTGTITPATTVSLCPSPATLSVTGDTNIGGTVTIDIVGATGLGFTGYGFTPNIPIPLPCGCDVISDGAGNLGYFEFISSRGLAIPCDPYFIGVSFECQGIDAFPTSGGCSFLGIPFGLTDIWTVTIG